MRRPGATAEQPDCASRRRPCHSRRPQRWAQKHALGWQLTCAPFENVSEQSSCPNTLTLWLGSQQLLSESYPIGKLTSYVPPCIFIHRFKQYELFLYCSHRSTLVCGCDQRFLLVSTPCLELLTQVHAALTAPSGPEAAAADRNIDRPTLNRWSRQPQ